MYPRMGERQNEKEDKSHTDMAILRWMMEIFPPGQATKLSK